MKIYLYICPWTSLFLRAHSFPQASLFQNCLHPRTGNVCRQVSLHIFSQNRGYFNKMNRIYIFIASILKSLVICAIWLAVTGVIYSHIALFYAINCIVFSASETALLKCINQPSFKAWFKKRSIRLQENEWQQLFTNQHRLKKIYYGLEFGNFKIM